MDSVFIFKTKEVQVELHSYGLYIEQKGYDPCYISEDEVQKLIRLIKLKNEIRDEGPK